MPQRILIEGTDLRRLCRRLTGRSCRLPALRQCEGILRCRLSGDRVFDLVVLVRDRVGRVVPGVLHAVAQFGSLLFERLVDLLGAVFDVVPALLDLGSGLLLQFVEFITRLCPKLVEFVAGAVSELADFIAGAVPKLIEFVAGLIPQIAECIAGLVPQITEHIVGLVPKLAELILGLGQPVFELIPERHLPLLRRRQLRGVAGGELEGRDTAARLFGRFAVPKIDDIRGGCRGAVLLGRRRGETSDHVLRRGIGLVDGLFQLIRGGVGRLGKLLLSLLDLVGTVRKNFVHPLAGLIEQVAGRVGKIFCPVGQTAFHVARLIGQAAGEIGGLIGQIAGDVGRLGRDFIDRLARPGTDRIEKPLAVLFLLKLAANRFGDLRAFLGGEEKRSRVDADDQCRGAPADEPGSFGDLSPVARRRAVASDEFRDVLLQVLENTASAGRFGLVVRCRFGRFVLHFFPH